MNLPFQREKDKSMKVLEVMYEERIIGNPDIDTGFVSSEDANELIKSATLFDVLGNKIDGDYEKSLQRLESAGLVLEYKNNNVSLYGLTNEGVQLAHQIKSERQRRNTNLILTGLTAVLVVLTVLLVVNP